MTLSGTTLKRSVSNDTAVFSFIDDITVAKNATYLVARDIDCEDDIKSKTSTLSVGNNTFYILVENENSIRLYTVIIRRLDVYTVSFIENGGSEVEDIEIQEGSVMSAPAIVRPGYTFVSWDYDFTSPVMQNLTISASWTVNTNTPYRVEYYLENAAKNGYDISVDELEGTTDTTATAAQKSFDHFAFDSSKSVMSGKIEGNGSLVLKVYYTRNSYTVSTDRNNSKGGTVTSGGTYVYEENKTITLTATTNAGYTFLGWFEGEEKVCSTLTYTFTVDHTATYTAKWEANTKTPYKVEYYLENVDKNGYDLSVDELEGTTDTIATAAQKSFDHFTFDSSKSVVSGNIDGDGSLVLKVYYTRNSYTVSTDRNNSKGGNVTSGGTYAYEKEITLTATTNAGYTFLGWFEGEKKVCGTLTYTFEVDHTATYTAKWEANTNTPYRVEYYLENVDKNGYDVSADELEGTTDTTVTAAQKRFDHFTFDSSKSVVSGNIDGNGSLVLKVYYTRNT